MIRRVKEEVSQNREGHGYITKPKNIKIMTSLSEIVTRIKKCHSIRWSINCVDSRRQKVPPQQTMQHGRRQQVQLMHMQPGSMPHMLHIPQPDMGLHGEDVIEPKAEDGAHD